MSYAQYFRMSSYCLIASGFMAIAATGAIGFFWACLYAAALLVSWFIDTGAFRKRIPEWLLNTIVLAYLPFGILDYRVISGSFMLGITHLVLFVAALKLLTLSTDRDYAYLYFISFAQLLAASALTIDIFFGFALLAFLLSGVSTLVLYEMRRSNARALQQGAIQPLVAGSLRGTGLELFSPFPAWRITGICLSITFLILLLAAPLFILLPRIALGIYRRPSGRTQMVSGFSERVELGTIGTIKESDTVVMRVRLDQLPPGVAGSLKWRGIALDYYDGRAWSRSRLGRNRVPLSGEFFKLERSIQGTQLLEQTFFLEALSTDVVFAGHKILAVSNDLGILWRDTAGNLFTMRHAENKIRYQAVSDVTAPDPDLIPLQPVSIPWEIGSTYLQLPELDPRIARLARDVTQGIPHPFEKARGLERYLRSHYSYSLELEGAPDSKDPLAMFLFDVRRGHCEYFATAMAVMLRQLGTPARLVNGFRAGEFNRIGDSFTVRQYDAHSWVEGWFEPYGWVEFDPTPTQPRHPKPAIARMLSDFVDAIGLWWWEGIVNYDVWKQSRIIRDTRAGILSLQRSIRQHLLQALGHLYTAGEQLQAGSRGGLKSLLLFVPALILGSLAYAVSRLSAAWASKIRHCLRALIFRRKSGELMAAFYREALELLRRHGFTRGASQTPLEFAESMRDHPAGGPLADLTSLYYRLRFGCPDAINDFSEAEGLLQVLRSALRRGSMN